MLVILDPAHGSNVSGKCSPDKKLREYLWSREMLGRIEKKLKAVGIDSVWDWTGTTEPGLTKRCTLANAIAKNHSGKSIFISFHVNAAGSDGKWHTGKGWEIYVSNNASSSSKKLASYIANAAKATGLKIRTEDPGRLYKVARFTVLQKTSMPAVLVENLFQDNKEEVDYLLSKKGKNTLTEIVIKGVCDYFGVEYHE